MRENFRTKCMLQSMVIRTCYIIHVYVRVCVLYDDSIQWKKSRIWIFMNAHLRAYATAELNLLKYKRRWC